MANKPTPANAKTDAATRKATQSVADALKSTTALTVADMEGKDSSTGNVIIAGIASLLPEVRETLTAIDNHAVSGEKLNMQLIHLALRQHEAVEMARVNSRPSRKFSEMVDSRFEMTDAGKNWIKDVIGDFIPVKVSKPAKVNGMPSQDKAANAAYDKQRAHEQAIRDACRAAIAIGFHGGKSTDYKDGVMLCNVAAFLPVQPKDTPKLMVWKFMDEEEGKVELDGTQFTLRRRMENNPKAKFDFDPGRFNVSQLKDRFYKLPEFIRIAEDAARAAAEEEAKKKGADGERDGQFTAEDKAKLIKTLDLDDMLPAIDAILSSDKAATDGLHIGDFDSKPKVWSGLQRVALLYGRLATEAQQRATGAKSDLPKRSAA
ncbi:MAG TPA: hypothetical protein VGN34_28260 [Ktedonobacteraceae bacterium]